MRLGVVGHVDKEVTVWNKQYWLSAQVDSLVRSFNVLRRQVYSARR
jgi:hypothetical protein